MNDAELMSAIIVGIIVAFYLMFWRPDQKARERRKKQMRDLRPGDRVLTTANFIATVREINVRESGQTQLSLELADGVQVTALPGAILERLPPEAPGGAPGEQSRPEARSIKATRTSSARGSGGASG